jgi:hypothetical protein
MWTLVWGFPDTTEGFEHFLSTNAALDFVRRNWDPSADIVTALRDTGEWGEYAAALAVSWVNLA